MRRIWFCFLSSIAVGGLLASPVAAQADLVDPGLDSIKKTVPAGYQRAIPDRIPKGPMTAAEFNDIGSTDVPERNDDAVFYGATYGKQDGSIMVFLAMSTTREANAQDFADGVMQGTFTDGVRFSTGVAGADGVEGELNGAHVVAISLARNGRGFAMLSFGDSAKGNAIKFAGVIANVAQSTPTRSDTTTIDPELSSLIGPWRSSPSLSSRSWELFALLDTGRPAHKALRRP